MNTLVTTKVRIVWEPDPETPWYIYELPSYRRKGEAKTRQAAEERCASEGWTVTNKRLDDD